MIDELSVIRRENILKLMDQHHLTKKEFADKIGVNSQTIYNTLKPTKTVTERTMDHVYAAFPNLPKDSLNYRDAEVITKEKKTADFLPVPTSEVMITFGFKKPIAIPLPSDEARELLISLIE